MSTGQYPRRVETEDQQFERERRYELGAQIYEEAKARGEPYALPVEFEGIGVIYPYRAPEPKVIMPPDLRPNRRFSKFFGPSSVEETL